MVLKVWQKTIAALGVITIGAGSALAGTYFYANSKYGRGYGHHSSRSMENNLNLLKEVKKYDLNLMDPNSPNKVLAKFDFEKNQIEHQDADKWILEYQQKNKKSPIFNVEAGPVRFQNYAPELVRPKDYVQFVTWFSKNISWGADLSSLSFFRIVRGAIIDNGTVTLGSFKVDKFATKRINFSPEAFFGMTNSKDFLKVFSQEGYTRKELDKFIEYVNGINSETKDKARRMRIYSVEKRGDLYYPTLANNSKMINKIAEYNPLLVSKVSDLEPVIDENNQISLITKPSYKVKYAIPISNLQVWRGLAGKKWKGIDFEWLKYVTHHEYGHMQTMGMLNDEANNPIGLGTPNGTALTKAGAAFDLDELNRYFAARLPNIRALRAAIKLRKIKDKNGKFKYGWDFYQDRLKEWKDDPVKNEKPDPSDFTTIGFEILNANKKTWTKESIEDIFGSTANADDPNQAPLKVNIDDFMTRIKTGRRPRFFMQSIKDVRELAKRLGISQAALYVMNAIDPMIATVSPGFTNIGNSMNNSDNGYTIDPSEVVKLLSYFNKKGHFKGSFDKIVNLKDKDGKPFFKEIGTPKNYHAYKYKTLMSKGNQKFLKGQFGKNIILIPTKYSHPLIKGYDWKLYRLNSNVHDKDGKSLMTSKVDPKDTKKQTWTMNKNGQDFIALIKKIISTTMFRSISGSEYINGTHEIGVNKKIKMPTLKELQEGDTNTLKGGWRKWVKNPIDRDSLYLNSLFADYTFRFEEILTRDWVQITQNQTKESHFKYGSRFFDINEKELGIEMLFDVSKLLRPKVEGVSYKDYSSREYTGRNNIVFSLKLLNKILLNSKNEKNKLSKSLYKKMTNTNSLYELGINQLLFTPSEKSEIFWDKLGAPKDPTNPWSEIKNKSAKELSKIWKQRYYVPYSYWSSKFLAARGGWKRTQMTNNGFFVDRWLRKTLNWELYNDKGKPKKYTGSMKSFNGKKIETIPESYWNFFMKSRGVGLRTLSKIWREPSRDAYTMWGYIPLTYKDKIKYLRLTNVKTGKKVYVPIQTNVDNLFYYKDKQASGKRHYLKEDGFTSWSTKNFTILGTWADAVASNGKWSMDFVDQSKSKVKIMHNNKELSILGNNKESKDNKAKITTNNLSSSFTAIVIMKNQEGKEIMVIKNEFPI